MYIHYIFSKLQVSKINVNILAINSPCPFVFVRIFSNLCFLTKIWCSLGFSKFSQQGAWAWGQIGSEGTAETRSWHGGTTAAFCSRFVSTFFGSVFDHQEVARFSPFRQLLSIPFFKWYLFFRTPYCWQFDLWIAHRFFFWWCWVKY